MNKCRSITHTLWGWGGYAIRPPRTTTCYYGDQITCSPSHGHGPRHSAWEGCRTMYLYQDLSLGGGRIPTSINVLPPWRWSHRSRPPPPPHHSAAIATKKSPLREMALKIEGQKKLHSKAKLASRHPLQDCTNQTKHPSSKGAAPAPPKQPATKRASPVKSPLKPQPSRHCSTSLSGENQTDVPVQLRNRCESAMRGLGYGSHIERSVILPLFDSHSCPLFPNLCTSSALSNL